MNRRDVITALSTTMIGSTSWPASMIVQGSPFGPIKRAYVAHPSLVRQSCPEWCWAASISMIFAYYHHRLDQSRIVQRVWGAPACVPSGNPANTINALNTSWTDDYGNNFTAQVGTLVDVVNGVGTLSNADIIDELENDHPVMYMNTHHCMVLVTMDYIDTPAGPQPQAAGVLDPWPYSPAFHPLTPAEMYLAPVGQATVIATVRVS
jgi:Papain-like cysteine protease AvrRpt2